MALFFFEDRPAPNPALAYPGKFFIRGLYVFPHIFIARDERSPILMASFFRAPARFQEIGFVLSASAAPIGFPPSPAGQESRSWCRFIVIGSTRENPPPVPL